MYYIDNVQKIKSKIYVYGAGMVAKLLYNYLAGKNIEIIAFVVTKSPRTVQYLYGKLLVSVNEIKKDYQIIIATLSNIHGEIENILTTHGFSNYMAISESFFERMRLSIVPYRNELASIKLRKSEMKKLYNCSGKDCLVVSDSKLLRPDKLTISSEKFLEFDRNIETVYMLLISWQENWMKVVNKAFCIAENVILSFRYKYLSMENYSLIDVAKEHGYQLNDSNRFYRDEREYFTEDILLWFERRSPQTLERDALCEGCGLCEMNCPVQAIQFTINEYGYKKPRINRELCIDCRKCVAKCPVYFKENQKTIPKTFAYMGNDILREHSSSGGVFGAIAQYILSNNGYVCGATWKERFQVEHMLIDKIKDLPKLQMSKYIRSDIREVMPEIKEILALDKKTLFVGCPCQVAAVKEFIGENENLFTIDLICAEAPSCWILKKYLEENYNVANIVNIGFREKQDGWRPDSFYIMDKKGEKFIKHIEDPSQRAFHSRMMMDISCEHCNFIKIPRTGDISIGDAWGIPEHDISLDDKKGTSVIIINNKKGEELYRIASRYAKKIKEIPFEWTNKNRTVNCIFPHTRRDRFYREIKDFGFNKAFDDADKDQYDIGIVGNWSYPNYGSELTYFALYHTLKDMGYSVLMIEWAEDSYWKPYGCTQLFETEPYANDEIAQPSRTHYEMYRYNDKCRMFILGSDQLFNPDLYHGLGKNASLDWVYPDKKKIGYALSIGRTDVEYTAYDKKEISYYLKKFDDVSVREKTAVDQMRNIFEISVDWVLDPVFLCEKNWYREVGKRYHRYERIGIFAYILDLNDEIESGIIKIAERMEETAYIFTDAAKKITEDRRITFESLDDISVEKWLGEIINSRFVIADSFHGICFAIIFHKNFIALRNNYRGGTRFDSILGMLGLNDRLVEDINDLFKTDLLNKEIDFDEIEKKLSVEKERSFMWLKKALKKEHLKKYSDNEQFLVEKIKRLESIIDERRE